MRTAMRLRSLLLAGVSLAIVSCHSTKPFDAVEGGIATHSVGELEPKLPDGWRLDAISRAVPGPDRNEDRAKLGTAHVLAWRVSQDDRPFTVEHCLVLKEFSRHGADRHWVLASIYRHTTDEWHLSFVSSLMMTKGREMCCRTVRHCKSFDSPPRNKDVYAFMDEFDCGLAPGSGWKLVRGRVCTQTWRATIGEEPTRFFPDSREHRLKPRL
jgi:hypothetical protein